MTSHHPSPTRDDVPSYGSGRMTGPLPSILGALGLLVTFAPWHADEAAAAPRLRPTIQVEGEIVTLGDLFGDAGEFADVAVADAPAPGQRSVLSLASISQVARRVGLPWRGGEGLRRVVVKRVGTPVSESAIKQEIRDVLLAAGHDYLMSVELNRRSQSIYVPMGADPAVEVEHLDYDRRSNRFTASLYMPEGVSPDNRARVAGRIVPLIEIPVLRHRVGVGQVIGDDDIEWLAMPSSRAGHRIVTDSEDIIGRTPKRTIRPGQPLRLTDVQRPVMIKRGSIVTMVVLTPFMKLTASGRALDSGGKGEIIRVLNTSSHQTVQVIVDGPNQGHVLTLGQQIAARR